MKKLFASLSLLFMIFHASGQQQYIVGYEYWCDTSYSTRVYVPITPEITFTLDTMLGFPGVEKGMHTMNIRFQQINLFWSQTISSYFYKTGEGPSSIGKIKAYRYWV